MGQVKPLQLNTPELWSARCTNLDPHFVLEPILNQIQTPIMNHFLKPIIWTVPSVFAVASDFLMKHYSQLCRSCFSHCTMSRNIMAASPPLPIYFLNQNLQSSSLTTSGKEGQDRTFPLHCTTHLGSSEQELHTVTFLEAKHPSKVNVCMILKWTEDNGLPT